MKPMKIEEWLVSADCFTAIAGRPKVGTPVLVNGVWRLLVPSQAVEAQVGAPVLRPGDRLFALTIDVAAFGSFVKLELRDGPRVVLTVDNDKATSLQPQRVDHPITADSKIALHLESAYGVDVCFRGVTLRVARGAAVKP